MTEKEKVYRFLDKQFSGDTFNDYDNKESIIEYAIEYVEENNRLTQGCGVGPLISYIKSWVDEFEQQGLTNEIFKYDEKLLNELNRESLIHEKNIDELKQFAIYLYSVEHQQQLLKQVIEQILNKKRKDNIKFSIELSLTDELKTIFVKFEKKLQIFLNKYVNENFNMILNENISDLYEAFDIEDLKDKKEIKIKF